ncbi:MAG: DMT family transporter [Pseudomonadota bacterium]|nr:DMT family transporter [Pseudomonadota bacterium]
MSKLLSIARSPYFVGAAAIFFASCMNAMIKGLSVYESVVVITAWRYTLGATLVIVLWFIFRPPLPGWAAIPFHTFRGFFQISAASLFFWSVTQIPLVTAAALGLTGTLMIGPLAWLLMREPLNRDVIGGTLVGFAGALFIVNTETQLLSRNIDGPVLGYLAPILASLCHALSVVLLRFRSQSEDPIVVAFFANTLPALYVLPVFLFMDAQPTAELFGGYILSAFFGVSFWSLTTIAYARAPAAKLAPITYTQLIWSATIGLLIFDELPGVPVWFGSAVIVAACAYVMRTDQRVN